MTAPSASLDSRKGDRHADSPTSDRIEKPIRDVAGWKNKFFVIKVLDNPYP